MPNGIAKPVRTMKPYHTTTEVARMLGVSRQTVLRMVHAGQVKTSQTPGGFNRIPADEVARLLTEQGIDQSLTGGPNGRVRVLIIDDDREVLDSLQRALKPAGDRLEVETVSPGPEALLVVGEQRPDLVILDPQNESMGGIDACAAIRKRYGDRVRIIGVYEKTPTRKPRKAKLDAIFTRPLPLVEVLDAIGRLV